MEAKPVVEKAAKNDKKKRPVKSSKRQKPVKKNTPIEKDVKVVVKPIKEKVEQKHRDFNGDLVSYLEQWAGKDEADSNWKFSKVLQTWALENCFHKTKIENDTFKILLPYLCTVQGQARDRLLASASVVIENYCDDTKVEENETQTENVESAIDKNQLKRALKVKGALEKC